jgi:hypothetical protein
VCFAYGKKRQNVVRGRGTQTASTATVATNAGVGFLWWWRWSSPATTAATSAATTSATRPGTEKGSHRHHRQADGTIQALVGRESIPSSPGGRWRCGRRGSDHRRSIHLVPPMIIIHTDDVKFLSSRSTQVGVGNLRHDRQKEISHHRPDSQPANRMCVSSSRYHSITHIVITIHRSTLCTAETTSGKAVKCIGGRVAASAGLSRRQLFMISSQDTRKRVLSNIPVPSGRTKEFRSQFLL